MDKQDVLGYYDYYKDSYSYSLKGKGEGRLSIDKNPSDVRRFF